uniref:Uncharacterized protein n=1 Tax=Rhipicephalus appendiculatus TaxID=34631 RepID=A0A131YDD1_RHIAP
MSTPSSIPIRLYCVAVTNLLSPSSSIRVSPDLDQKCLSDTGIKHLQQFTSCGVLAFSQNPNLSCSAAHFSGLVGEVKASSTLLEHQRSGTRGSKVKLTSEVYQKKVFPTFF